MKNKYIALGQSPADIEKIFNALQDVMGPCYIWQPPSGNIFITDHKDFFDICCYKSGRFSVYGFCGLKHNFETADAVVALIMKEKKNV